MNEKSLNTIKKTRNKLLIKRNIETNKDNIIKDLREKIFKLKEQYRLRDMKCIYLERENEQLMREIIQKNKLIKGLNEINNKIKEQYELLEHNF